jgi:dimethylhistidine N-methyltransferase
MTVTSLSTRFTFREIPDQHISPPFCAVVAEGLSAAQKSLPCRFFYDQTGSELFEQICRLPEYYLTRTERAILEQYAPEILKAAGQNAMLVEFGSGSSCKTRLLQDAALAQQSHLHYIPIDISADFLYASALTLLNEYPRLTVTALAAEYRSGITALPAHQAPRLILFLGSSIGNFTREEAIDFLTHIRRQMRPEDRLLVGADLVKERTLIEAAYNDTSGVTAAFNKNLLTRINRELGADFQLDAYTHTAPFVAAQSRIEMHLVSQRRQRVRIAALEQSFLLKQGETIHTENSHKYSVAGFTSLGRAAGLIVQNRWQDARAWFSLFLLQPGPLTEPV